MSNENLKRAEAEIKAALDTTINAERTSNDPELSFVDGDTFKQIARPLRRALRLVKPKTDSRCVLELRIEHDDATQGEVEAWKLEGQIYEEMLRRLGPEHPFTKAFTKIFFERLLNHLPLSHSVGALFPLAILTLQGWEPGESMEVAEVFRIMREALAPEVGKEIEDRLSRS